MKSTLTSDMLASLAKASRLLSPSIFIGKLGGSSDQGFSVQLAPDEKIYPASMIKVPLAVALVTRWVMGQAVAHARVTISAGNMTATDGNSPFAVGYEATQAELVERMLTHSDNVATNEVIDLLERESATAEIAALGASGTAIRRKLSGSEPLIDDPQATGRNTHPVCDAALLFERIARREVPGAAWLEATLLRQAWNDKLSRGLLPHDRFAHKTGETSEGSHDGGILHTADGHTYIIVVYTSLPAGPSADASLGNFMSELRPFL